MVWPVVYYWDNYHHVLYRLLRNCSMGPLVVWPSQHHFVACCDRLAVTKIFNTEGYPKSAKRPQTAHNRTCVDPGTPCVDVWKCCSNTGQMIFSSRWRIFAVPSFRVNFSSLYPYTKSFVDGETSWKFFLSGCDLLVLLNDGFWCYICSVGSCLVCKLRYATSIK